MNPMLACDWVQRHVRLPIWLQPKIDGVRALTQNDRMTARSLKPHANVYTTELFSVPFANNLDGELAAERETHPDLCRITSSALRTREGRPFTLWWIFDSLENPEQPYHKRYETAKRKVELLTRDGYLIGHRMRIVPYVECRTIDDILHWEAKWLEEGYEGVIGRDPMARHKAGRCTALENNLWRIKRFEDDEAEVVRYEEGTTNANPAQINELGRQFRTTHAENMIPNGQVGTIVAKRLRDGMIINVSPGNMDAATRAHEWTFRDSRPGTVFTYKHFNKGVKDKPRFPTWKCWRDSVDMSS